MNCYVCLAQKLWGIRISSCNFYCGIGHNTAHIKGLSFAENASPAPDVSPEVNKIRAETDQWRVMAATWQPGQEDNFHYHPANRGSLIQTDCNLRLTKPDDTFIEKSPKAGVATACNGKSVASHKAKNIGDKVCTVIILELK